MSIYITEHHIPRPNFLGGDHWILHGLTDLTVILGKNGSGKSQLLRSWRDRHIDQVHYVVPERTGEMDFQPNFLQDELDADRRRGSSTRNFALDYRRRIIGRIQSYFMTRGDNRGTEAPPGNPNDIEELLSLLLPDFTTRIQASSNPYVLTRVATGETIGGADQLSSGEAQLLTIGLDILSIASIWEVKQQAIRILLIDEPDAHIHPDLQVRFMDFLIQAGKRYDLQIVVSTHSTSLLSAAAQLGGNQVSSIYLERERHEYTAKPFDDVTREIAACLGGHILMGPLFGAPILLVEGDDDYRIWAQVPRHHQIKLAVIPSNGDEIFRYQKSLEKILGTISTTPTSPVGYALLDGDKKVPQPNPQNPQAFICFIGLNCHEAENLYLSTEVLALLGTNWPDAQIQLAAAADQLGIPELKDAPHWDTCNADIKPYIRAIAQVLDPIHLDWTIRVGTAIGKSRPTGELAEFLGSNVVGALWPVTEMQSEQSASL